MYLQKFMKYNAKCRYLSALTGGAEKETGTEVEDEKETGAEVEDEKKNADKLLAEIKMTSLVYVFVLKDKQKIDEVAIDIFLKNHIDKKIASGNSKLVYSIRNDNKDVFKLVMCEYKSLARFISEPLFMLECKYSNKPRDINVYLKTSEKKYDCGPHIHFNYIDNIGDNVIMTWREEKALYTGLTNFPPVVQEMGKKFIEETTEYLTGEGYVDLGYVNVGWFKYEPHIRWFDLQPSTYTEQNCIRDT